MDLQSLLAWAGPISAIGTAVLGHFVNGYKADLKAAEAKAEKAAADAQNLRAEMYRDFVPHVRFDNTVRQINDKLDKVIDILADKADK